MKSLIFVILCGSFLFLHDLAELLQHIENIFYLFLLIRFIVTFLFLTQSGESMYDSPQFRFYDIYNAITEHKDKLATSAQL